jgi:hypothetical protein
LREFLQAFSAIYEQCGDSLRDNGDPKQAVENYNKAFNILPTELYFRSANILFKKTVLEIMLIEKEGPGEKNALSDGYKGLKMDLMKSMGLLAKHEFIEEEAAKVREEEERKLAEEGAAKAAEKQKEPGYVADSSNTTCQDKSESAPRHATDKQYRNVMCLRADISEALGVLYYTRFHDNLPDAPLLLLDSLKTRLALGLESSLTTLDHLEKVSQLNSHSIVAARTQY